MHRHGRAVPKPRQYHSRKKRERKEVPGFDKKFPGASRSSIDQKSKIAYNEGYKPATGHARRGAFSLAGGFQRLAPPGRERITERSTKYELFP